MATTIANFNHQYQFNKADTYNYTIQNAGNKYVNVRITDVTNPGGFTVTIKQNSTTLNSNTGSTSGNDVECNALGNFAANDTLSVVVSSSAASDSAPNQFVGTIVLNDLAGGNG